MSDETAVRTWDCPRCAADATENDGGTAPAMACGYCDGEVHADSRASGGRPVPITSAPGGRPFHIACLYRMVAGSAGHQLGRCSCHGGDDEDPRGMTRQDAALASWALRDGPAKARAQALLAAQVPFDAAVRAATQTQYGLDSMWRRVCIRADDEGGPTAGERALCREGRPLIVFEGVAYVGWAWEAHVELARVSAQRIERGMSLAWGCPVSLVAFLDDDLRHAKEGADHAPAGSAEREFDPIVEGDKAR